MKKPYEIIQMREACWYVFEGDHCIGNIRKFYRGGEGGPQLFFVATVHGDPIKHCRSIPEAAELIYQSTRKPKVADLWKNDI